MKVIVPVGSLFVSFLLFLTSPGVSAQVIIRERISIEPRVAPQGSLQETSDILLETDCDVTISAVSRFAAFPVTYFEINGLVIVNNSPTRYSELQLPPPSTAVMPAGTVLKTGSLTLTALVRYDRNVQDPDILENMQFVTWKLVRWSDAINPFDGRVRGLTFVMEANPNGNWWVTIGLVSRLDYFTVEVNPNILEASEEASLVVEGKAKDGSTVGLANGKRISLRTDFGLELVTEDQVGRNLDVPWSAVRDVKVRAAIVLGTGEFGSSVSAHTMWWGNVSGFGVRTTNPPVVTVRRTAPKPELRFEPVENAPYGGERFVAVTTVNQLGQPMAIPSAVTYTFALGDGRAWGMLGRGTTRGIPLADTITNVFQFNDLPRAGGKGGVMFHAWEAEPDEYANIAIHAWASDPAIKSAFKGLVVVPSPLAVTVTPATLRYGESALIDVRKKQTDGTTTTLPSGTSFLYEIVQVLQAGRLQSVDSTRNGDEVFDTEPQFRFLAVEEGPQPDSVQVWIAIKAWQPGTTKPLEGMAKIVVKKSSFSILLGETKYYQAKEEGDKLVIEELNEPVLNGGIAADVWGDNPVTKESGDKLSAYWEKKYPVYASTTFAGMDNLPTGVIRLVGRYWEEGKTYKVKLKASHNGKTGALVVEVKKPARLGNSYTKTTDVEGKELDIDKLLIEFAGQNGIPPQLIKGQMFKEADKTGRRFNPSYRYEPFFDRNIQVRLESDPRRRAYLKQPFVVRNINDVQMGEGNPIPSMDFHKNVFGRPYQRAPVAIGDYVFENWSFYTTVKDDGFLKIIGSEDEGSLTETWATKYKLFRKNSLDHTTASNAATIHVQSIILNDYTEVAQTRKSASYGFLQVLYTTAIQRYIGYEISGSKTPEALNEQAELMPVYKKFVEFNLKRQFGGPNAVVPASDWDHGYDETWRRVYDQYNPGERNRSEEAKRNKIIDIFYGARVLKHSRSFLPQAQ